MGAVFFRMLGHRAPLKIKWSLLARQLAEQCPHLQLGSKQQGVQGFPRQARGQVFVTKEQWLGRPLDLSNEISSLDVT